MVGGIFLGGALVVGALLTPAVQGWLVKRLVAGQPGWRVEFEKFGVGPGGLEVRGLDFAMPGVAVKSAPVNVRVLPTRLLRGEVNFQQVEVRQLRIEVTPEQLAKAAPAPAPGPAEPVAAPLPFAGVLALLRAPLPWIVQHTNVDAELVVNEGGKAKLAGKLSVRGEEFSPLRPGEFTYALTLQAAALPPGPENIVRSSGKLRLTQNAAHGLDAVELEGDFVPPREGAYGLPAGTFQLRIRHEAAGGETYAARLQFGRLGTLALAGRLDAAGERVDGTADLQVDAALLAGLAGGKVPAGTLGGKIAFDFNLKTSELNAALDSTLQARDWQQLLPRLAVLEPLTGALKATLAVRGGQATLTQASFALQGTATPFKLDLALTAPFALGTAVPVTQGTLAISHLPATWANPWLEAGMQATSGEFSGAWTIALEADRTARLSATQPMTLGPVGLVGPALPPLPAFTLTFSPRIEASPARLAVDCPDLVITSAQDDRVTLAVSAAHDVQAKETRFSGELSGALPTLLASPDHALPFTLVARWDMTQTARALRVAQLAFTAQQAGQPEPAVSLALTEPVEFGAPDELQQQRNIDLLKFKVRALPLAWISRWLQNNQLTGSWAAGESVLRRAPAGKGFVFVTREPWTLAGLGVTIGGKSFFRGQASLSPEFTLGEERSTAAVRDIRLADDQGNRLGGETTVAWHEADKKFSVGLALDAELPALPGSKDTFGALTAQLRAQAHAVDRRDSQVEQFRFEVRNAAGPLFAIAAPQPFQCQAQPNGELLFTSLAPLTVQLARIPLAWLKPWIPADAALAGTLEPATLELHAEPRKFVFRAPQPVRVSDLSYARFGMTHVQAASGSFAPGAQFSITHQLQPVFQLAYEGRLAANDGALDVLGQRAIDFRGAIGFAGDDKFLRFTGVDVRTRVDFAPLHRVPVLAENGVPAAGEFTFRLHADLPRDEQPEFETRLSGVPAADGKRVLPALEVIGRGRATEDARAFNFDVTTRFATRPQASDANFQLDVKLGEKTRTFASTFRSTFFDVGEVMALTEALKPPAARKAPAAPAPEVAAATPGPAPAAAAEPAQLPPLGVPFWNEFRGRFDLELGTIQMAPYRIDNIRGRLELTDHALTLTGFSGEMFSGRWDGELKVDYDPAAAQGDHTLTSHFKISQLETAKAIQTAFPNDYGSLDTRLDLDVSLRGRGNRWWELLERSEGGFTLEAHSGVARLTYPQLGTASTLLALAGTLSFSSEMRALGRLLSQFAEMPIQQLRVRGERSAAGDLALSEFRLDSPQARFVGQGKVPAVAGVPLAARRLDLTVDLYAKSDMATLLGNMKLLEKQPQPDGYRRMAQPFSLGGEVGKPDPTPLYDMLARAVDGASGTWSLIMRKVQKEVEKQGAAPAPKKTAAR